MIREEITAMFDSIADILQIKGEDPGKVKMYHNLAITISYALPDEIRSPFDYELLSNVRGIGPATLEKIAELVNTGKCQYYEDLKASIPAGVMELLSISGVGPSTAARLYQVLNIDSLEALQKAIDEQRLQGLKGMGKKTEEKIKLGLEALLRHKKLRLMGYVLPDALALVDCLASSLPACRNISIAGDLRRKTETIRDIQIVAVCPDASDIHAALRNTGLITNIHSDWTESGGSATLAGDVNMEFKLLDAKDFGAGMVYFTGSESHIKELNARANQAGLEPLSWPSPEWTKGRSEEEIYNSLELPYIIPELREGTGEISASVSGKLPKLIETADIRGDLHIHSTWSDGHQTIQAMAEAARNLGYEYIAFCDHSVSSKIANGLDIERILNKMIELREINEKVGGIEILMGAEVDILKNGDLDYPDEILEKLDVVIASIHSGFNMDEASMTKRIISAIENRFVHILGHPTGRLLAKRDPYLANMDAVIEAAAENKKVLEINSYPDRLDLKDTHIRKAKEKGVKMVINTDAHSISDLNLIKYGVYTA
ncbi:MAG: DNA polymerase/3'-5' exonuclease PolX, partial [Veillonellaceae bacterium]|nr:DNA polymerase/3'-5' exonuclease PolX [Veillonellaceae bacterium]